MTSCRFLVFQSQQENIDGVDTERQQTVAATTLLRFLFDFSTSAK